MRRGAFWAGLLACLALTSWGMARAGAPKAPQPAGPPDVLVLVFAVPGGPDQIGLTYPGTVPHAAALRDVQAIQAATGWKVSGLHIADLDPPVARPRGKMTGVDFVVPGAVVTRSRMLPVEPFVNSLRSYRHVTLTYLVGGNFGFEGLRSYADNHVSIALDQRGSNYTYQIYYRNGRFGHLNLPRYQLSNADARSAQTGPVRRANAPWLIALVALAAVGAGCLVYALLARNV